MTQSHFNQLILAAKADMERQREEAVREMAMLMYSRGYRAEELVIFHHEGQMQAVFLEPDNEQMIVTDSTRIYVGARTPVYESRLRMRRLWRRFKPYRDATVERIERRVFPCE